MNISFDIWDYVCSMCRCNRRKEGGRENVMERSITEMPPFLKT